MKNPINDKIAKLALSWQDIWDDQYRLVRLDKRTVHFLGEVNYHPDSPNEGVTVGKSRWDPWPVNEASEGVGFRVVRTKRSKK